MINEISSVGQILADLKAVGITQRDVASYLGLSQSAVSNLKNGTRALKYEEASKLQRLLKGVYKPRVIDIHVISMSNADQWAEAVLKTDILLTIPLVMGGEDIRASFGVEIVGDAVDQLMAEGTYAVIDAEQQELFSDRCYLLAIGDDVVVRRYKSDPARFEPASKNTDYGPLLIGAKEFRVLGRVTLALQKF